jgi:hypothetical protein
VEVGSEPSIEGAQARGRRVGADVARAFDLRRIQRPLTRSARPANDASQLLLRQTPTHGVLAHRAGERRTQRAAHTARVGAGEIAAGDQRIGGQRAAPVRGSSTRGSCRREYSAGHFHLNLAERSQQRSRPMAMTVTDDRVLLRRACRSARCSRRPGVGARRSHPARSAPRPTFLIVDPGLCLRSAAKCAQAVVEASEPPELRSNAMLC